MKKSTNSILIGMFILALFLIIPIRIGKANGAGDLFYSYETTSAPTIDGTFDNASEWSDAYHTAFYHDNPSVGHRPGWVHIYMKHTNETLYILIDDIPDNTSETNDGIDVSFDCNHDGVKDNNISMRLLKDKSGSSIYYGNHLANWSVKFDGSVNENTNHSILEIAINITMDDSYDGSSRPKDIDYTLPIGTLNNSIKFAFTVPIFFCNWTVPQDALSGDPTTYASLVFTKKPSGAGAVPFANFGTIILITSISIIGIIIIMQKRKEI